MKKLLSLLALAMTLCVVTACNDEEVPANGYIETTQSGASTFVLKGYESVAQGFSVLKPAGFTTPYYIKDKAFYGAAFDFIPSSEKRLEDMTVVPENGNWQPTAAIVPGQTYWARYAGGVYKYIKFHVAYVDGNNVGIEYVVSDFTTARPNSNSNMESSDQGAWGLEIPHLTAGNFFAPHYVTFEGNTYMNLAIEWNAALRHSNWVAFSFDKNTGRDRVSRGNAWMWDPAIPATEGGVEESNHKSDGYDKGHLCASSDRLYCTEANDQTFYYTNISPMMNKFNTGFWSGLEEIVRNWGRSCTQGTFDHVYVAKGGTLNNLLKNFTATYKGNDNVLPVTDANGLTKGGLAVPAGYFMAVLAEKDGKFQALAFYVEHSDKLNTKPTTNELKACVLSIDELEKKTGIDFFCNLSDEVENDVESAVDTNLWAW